MSDSARSNGNRHSSVGVAVSPERSPDSERWDAFIEYARRFADWDGFARSERDYKLVLAERLRSARSAVQSDAPEWFDRLKAAFDDTNNLVDWRLVSAFASWCRQDLDRARDALANLWDSSRPVASRIRAFQQARDDTSRSWITLISFLLTADSETYAVFKPTPFARATRMTAYEPSLPARPGVSATGDLYEQALGFLDRIIAEGAARGLTIRDRLDAQSLLWCVTSYRPEDPPMNTWSEADREALLRFREGNDIADRPPPPPLPPAPRRNSTFADLMNHLEERELHFSEELVANYLLALQTKRFVILSGISGTGKTQLAMTVADFFRRGRGGLVNSSVVAVRPDWTDSRGLLGYLNPLTGEYSTTSFLRFLLAARDEVRRAGEGGRAAEPYFVVLDEMNLARVEHYFSDFLSALESATALDLHDSAEVEHPSRAATLAVPRQLLIPHNLLFTGTVNVDETTFAFSPKVLDRAFTIELNEVDLEGYRARRGNQPAFETRALRLGDLAGPFGWRGRPNGQDWESFSSLLDGQLRGVLIELNRLLADDNRQFGYRVANEIARFVCLANEHALHDESTLWSALDLAILEKVLPKFRGTQQELEGPLTSITRYVENLDPAQARVDNMQLAQLASEPPPNGAVSAIQPRLPRTHAKVQRMLRRLRQQGFASFIE